MSIWGKRVDDWLGKIQGGPTRQGSPPPDEHDVDRPWDHPKKGPEANAGVGSAAPQPAIDRWIKLGGVALVILFVGWCSVQTKQNVDESERTGDERGAISACHDRVKPMLKSPGSAEFGTEQISGTGPEWTVRGVVDSENSFGAEVRNSYDCTVRYEGNDRWSLVDLDTTSN